MCCCRLSFNAATVIALVAVMLQVAFLRAHKIEAELLHHADTSTWPEKIYFWCMCAGIGRRGAIQTVFIRRTRLQLELTCLIRTSPNVLFMLP